MSSQWVREHKSLCVYVFVCVSVCQCMCEQQVCEVSQQDPYVPASMQTSCFEEIYCIVCMLYFIFGKASITRTIAQGYIVSFIYYNNLPPKPDSYYCAKHMNFTSNDWHNIFTQRAIKEKMYCFAHVFKHSGLKTSDFKQLKCNQH